MILRYTRSRSLMSLWVPFFCRPCFRCRTDRIVSSHPGLTAFRTLTSSRSPSASGPIPGIGPEADGLRELVSVLNAVRPGWLETIRSVRHRKQGRQKKGTQRDIRDLLRVYRKIIG